MIKGQRALASIALSLATWLGAAAPGFAEPQATPVPVTAAAPAAPEPAFSLKRRIAIGRFSNATNYGRALLGPGESDPLADQAADMLAAQLVKSGRFIVLERRDLDAIQREQGLVGGGAAVGSDTLLIGSVTQFGRKIEGNVGFLNSRARQTASASVAIRLVDTRTGQAYFSTTGSGSADVEVKETAGFGGRAGYDSTLNDQAIAAAINDLMANLLQKLQERPWSTDVLTAQGGQVMISGGPREGLKVGDRLTVSRRGAVITSRQTGLPIELPAEPLAVIQVTGFFGSGDSEGASTSLVSGALPAETSNLVVTSAAP